jgi:hypothetical protein
MNENKTQSLKLIQVKSIIFSHIAFFKKFFSALLFILRKMETATMIASFCMWMEAVVDYFKALTQYYHRSEESHEKIGGIFGLRVEI